jgi:hypothetical protein
VCDLWKLDGGDDEWAALAAKELVFVPAACNLIQEKPRLADARRALFAHANGIWRDFISQLRGL